MLVRSTWGLVCVAIAVWAAGCSLTPDEDPRLREPLLVVEVGALAPLLEAAGTLVGTPVARHAAALLKTLDGCEQAGFVLRRGHALGRDRVVRAAVVVVLGAFGRAVHPASYDSHSLTCRNDKRRPVRERALRCGTGLF